jgi:hypothetical protein
MKFYTHMSKYVSKISPNFELNPTYESHTDLKIQHKLGFYWVFYNEFKLSFFSNRDQNLQQLGVCSGPKSITHHQSMPKPNPLKGIKCFFTNDTRSEKGETKTIKLQKFQQGYKLRFEAKKLCEPDRRPFL